MGLVAGDGRMTAVQCNPPLLADEDVAHNGEEPGLEAAAAIEEFPFPERAFDAVLDEVICIILITGQDTREPIQVRKQVFEVLVKRAHCCAFSTVRLLLAASFHVCRLVQKRVKVRWGFGPSLVKEVSGPLVKGGLRSRVRTAARLER
jgi:hypothetical protein